jgi:hypothetical protein
MAELAPSEASKAGIAVVAISWPTSENKEASPMPSTLRLSHRDFDDLSLIIAEVKQASTRCSSPEIIREYSVGLRKADPSNAEPTP